MASGTNRAQKRPKRTGIAFTDRWFTRGVGIALWWTALLCFVGIAAFPLSMGATRLASVILVGVLAAGLLALSWRYRFIRWGLLLVYVGLGTFLSLPGKAGYDRLRLRQETARASQRYEGARYVWGGENFLGIDCSGLIRRSAIDALFFDGFCTANPLLVRKAVRLWWDDVSARELESGANGSAQKLIEVKGIAGWDDSKLHPGDFAITRDGVHAVAYLGDHLWAEADPGEGRVIVVNARTTSNSWFHQPVWILRWRYLDLPLLVGKRR